MVIAPTTPATVYYTTDGSGVYRSLDGGDNWTQVVTGLTDLSVRHLVVDPVAPQTLYAATTDAIDRRLNAPRPDGERSVDMSRCRAACAHHTPRGPARRSERHRVCRRGRLSPR